MKSALHILSIAILTFGSLFAQENDSPTWRDFANKRTSGDLGITTIADFSYAGYKYSNSSIPNLSNWDVINVRDFNARPNDGRFDDEQIQNAIDAAQNSGRPTVIQFEAGRYQINPEGREFQALVISQSNIVLRGTGSGNNGTEIFSDRSRLDSVIAVSDNNLFNEASLYIGPTSPRTSVATKISGELKRGSFEINVLNASRLSVGQTIIIYHRNKNNRAPNGISYPDTPTTQEWIKMNNDGVEVREAHVIKRIDGNRITFENPIYLNMTEDQDRNEVRSANFVENVGVQSIRFTGNWSSYGETFIHHKPGDDFHDQGWNGLYFNYAVNSWMRDCELNDWNVGVQIQNSTAMTFERIKVTGQDSHHTFFSSRVTGSLFKDIENVKRDVHGIGFQSSSCGNVVLDHIMREGQSIDLHGKNPYANLFDNSKGGMMRGNGGALRNHPNAGPYHTFWNFEFNDTQKNFDYDFLTTSRRRNWTYLNPILVGVTSPSDTIEFTNVGKNESQNRKVYPSSIYQAQLQLRRFGSYMSAYNASKGIKASRANDDRISTFWSSEGNVANTWIMLDFGTPRTLDKIFIDERTEAIGDYELQYWDQNRNRWEELTSGNGIGSEQVITFNSTRLTTIRLFVQNKKSGSTDASIEINTFGVTEIRNSKPVVTITSPANNSTFKVGDEINITADVTDSDGSIDRVNFTVNNSFVAQDTEAPYEQNFTLTTVGTYQVLVAGFDNNNARTRENITITVTEDNPIPTVTLTSPTDGQLYEVGEVIDLLATASSTNPNADLRVEFKVNDVLHARDPAAPFVRDFTPTTFGEYKISAEVFDRTNSQSSEVSVNVRVADYAPPTGYSQSNREGETVRVTELVDIAYGANGSFEFLINQSNDIICNTTTFGNDPVRGYAKRCYTKPSVITSTNDLEDENNILTIYPNPSENGIFHLSENREWEIVDVEGKVILRGSENNFNMSSYSKGIYFLHSDNQVIRLIYE